MSEVRAFALPDVGEGLTEAEILRWHVRPGDVVKVNQTIVEIETAKASVELPCPFAGTVAELLVAEGAIVPVGSPIITVETPDAPPAAGASGRARGLRRARGRGRAASPASPGPRRPTPVGRRPATARPFARSRRCASSPATSGVDLATVTPTGAHGEVTRADVMGAGSAAPAPGDRRGTRRHRRRRAPTAPRQPGERLPVRGVHRAMADAMVQSAFTAPHVTEWVDVDMSRAMAVGRAAARAAGRGPACASRR